MTLYHVYRKRGKKLTEWPQWQKFVPGFDSSLFTVSHIQREDLLRDASRLGQFYKALSREQRRRLTAKISAGEQELYDLPGQISQLQNEVGAKRSLQHPMVVRRENQLRQIFPELQHLG